MPEYLVSSSIVLKETDAILMISFPFESVYIIVGICNTLIDCVAWVHKDLTKHKTYTVYLYANTFNLYNMGSGFTVSKLLLKSKAVGTVSTDHMTE